MCALRYGKCAVPATAAVIAALAAGPVLGQVEIGEHIPIQVVPPRGHATGDEADVAFAWYKNIRHPGASYIAVHFAYLDLGPGEYLVLSDARGGQSYKLKGKGKMGAGTFWARHVRGDTLRLQLVTAGGKPARRFAIDEYVAGYDDTAAIDGGRAVCGPDDRVNAACLKDSHPEEYLHGQAVARLLINGSLLCTGWLASTEDHLITSGHCITSAADALNTDFEFMAEAPTCESHNCRLCFPGRVFSGAELIRYDGELDYALVRIAAGNPAATYGFLEISDRAALAGEQVYIPQHPGGRAREFALFSSAVEDAGGVCRIASTDEAACTGTGFSDIGYFADTEAGASGSPVLATLSHKVIALHHCAGCPNRGVPMSLIHPRISEFIISSGMQVTPGMELAATGPAGGTFTPRDAVYTIRNLNDSEIDFMVTADRPWISIDAERGVLPAGGSVDVTVSLNAGADPLPVGTHGGIVRFFNTSDGKGDTTRGVTLRVGITRMVKQWTLDADPGWTTEGAWRFGRPSGGGGEFGVPDPLAGYTGDNVYGYNLDGDYANDLPETHLTSKAIDCRRLVNVTLRFRRWLGVERPAFDRAFVEVGDGTTWTRIWENPAETADTSWVLQEFDISAIADGRATVYLRWTMGPTDSAWRYCGWNIDDIELWAVPRKPRFIRRFLSIE